MFKAALTALGLHNIVSRLLAGDVTALYLMFGLFGVLPLIFLTPPFQVPDEHQHFYRAYQLSEMSLRSEVREGRAGAVLPSALPELAESFLGTRALIAVRQVRPSPLSETLNAFTIPLNPDRREFVDFTGAAFYSPLPYLPQVFAIVLGRAFEVGPLGLMYLARLANGLAALFLVSTTLRVLPAGKVTLFIVGLLPIVLYQFASVSPDAATIGSAFMFTAIAARARLRGYWTGREIGAACILGSIFCSLKPVYAPLLFIGLPAIFQQGSAVNAIKAHTFIVVISLSVTALWIFCNSSFSVIFRDGTDPSAQLAGIVLHPVEFGRTVINTLWMKMGFWMLGVIGFLGWQTIRLPAIMYLMPVLAVLGSLVLANPPVSRVRFLEILWYAGLIGSSSLLIVVALYLYWTPVSLSLIEGIQGRYFLPLSALAAVMLSAVARPIQVYRFHFATAVLFVVAAEVLLTSVVTANTYEVLCDCWYLKGTLISQGN